MFFLFVLGAVYSRKRVDSEGNGDGKVGDEVLKVWYCCVEIERE